MKKVSKMLKSGYFFHLYFLWTVTAKHAEVNAKCAKELLRPALRPSRLQPLHKPGDNGVFPGDKRAILNVRSCLPHEPQIKRQVLQTGHLTAQ